MNNTNGPESRLSMLKMREQGQMVVSNQPKKISHKKVTAKYPREKKKT